MKAVAAPTALLSTLLLITGCATRSAIPLQVPGSYDGVWERDAGGGKCLPQEDGFGYRIDVMPTGEWELFDLTFPGHLARGWYWVRGEEEGCVQLHFLPLDAPEAVWPAELCEGVMSLDQKGVTFSVWHRGILGKLRGTPAMIESSRGAWFRTWVFEKRQ